MQHFDAHETWSSNPGPVELDLQSDAVHEIGCQLLCYCCCLAASILSDVLSIASEMSQRLLEVFPLASDDVKARSVLRQGYSFELQRMI
ncbi:hypothetical protein NC653_011944 [Populus alba x Populus x berolinensis]|uniref:Uncharacterized protein n=1 Tax=Populus alba x Populus x berolinensis TaxID=444605 RepID=A0AAD6W8J7_9ROSI|nr:hypothetical protein NC653_011944 [Populus alba x Populus x berolinensis]